MSWVIGLIPEPIQRFWITFPLLLVAVWLVGCQSTETMTAPTRAALAALPPLEATAVASNGAAAANAPQSGRSGQVVINQDGETETISSLPAGGVRPAEAEQRYVRDTGPELPADQRPPAYDVPLSIHPDDHYWLIRPIPSRYRNYDLDWYPFGNNVLRPDLGPYRIHHGIDFPNETGTPIVAAASGTVVHAGPLPSPRNGVNYYGNTVIVEHDWQWQGKPVFTLYAHTLELFVEEGDTVNQGQLLAGVGSSGEVSGPHLHFEVRVGGNAYALARNPALWLAPFEGYGTLAGRLVDRRGRPIPEAELALRTLSGAGLRLQRTYHPSVQPDEAWQENFVFADVPAGGYELLLTVGDITYRREVEVYPGQTSFEIVSTTFEFVPTPTPLPTATPTAVPEAEATPDP